MAKLLIVDDEADVREFTANFFRRRSIDVITASGGREALEITRKHRPELVLLDIRMEGISGIETLKRIKEHDKSIKVIMVTGKKPEEEDAYGRCRQLGASEYILKPLKLDELEKIVKDILKD
ncbi:MAG: response regulator [Candidatus Omnitrophica bacterium]|nr:response regulator [Candidatus Omnitrophota bacterium]